MTRSRKGRPEPGEVKGIVVDIDGTLSDTQRRIGLEAVSALRSVNDSGVPVMLASGNVLPIAYSLSLYLGFDGPVIAENGGIVCHGQRIWVLASPEEPRRAYEHLRTRMSAERLFTDRWRETEVGIRQDTSLEEVVRELDGFEVEVQGTGWAIHIMEKGMDKSVGVRKACEILGLSTDDVAAVGDSENDEMMLRECGWGVSVANASERTKDAATHAVDGESGDGVLQALEWLRLL